MRWKRFQNTTREVQWETVRYPLKFSLYKGKCGLPGDFRGRRQGWKITKNVNKTWRLFTTKWGFE
jgi:hypothetical protein